MASVEFSNHGCNDFDLSEHFTPDEQESIHNLLTDFINDPPYVSSGKFVCDSMLMEIMAKRIMQDNND